MEDEKNTESATQDNALVTRKTQDLINDLSTANIPTNPSAIMKADEIKSLLFGNIYEAIKGLSEDLCKIEWIKDIDSADNEEQLPPTTEAVKSALENKVSKEDGKGLSSNDFTNDYIQKIEEISDSFDNVKSGVETEIAARASADTALDGRISAERQERKEDINSIKANAVKIKSYNSTTGELTFTDLNGGNSRTLNIFLESEFSDDSYFDNENAEFVLVLSSGKEIRIPAPDMLNITWENEINDDNSSSQIPPTTEAVKNYIDFTQTAEATARTNADNTIKAAAIGTPTLSGQELVFPNLNGSELKRITLPSGGSGSGGYSHLPLQRGNGNSNSCRLQEVAPKVYRARIWFDVGELYCASGINVNAVYFDNWRELLPTYAEQSRLQVSIATVPIHDVAQSVGVSLTKTSGYLYFSSVPENGYIPSHDWYAEIEVDLNQNQCVIKAFQCDNY